MNFHSKDGQGEVNFMSLLRRI